MFERTRPIGSPELMRVSEFRRYLHDLAAPATAVAADGTRMPQVGSLGPSLMADLRRSRSGDAHEPLEVLAACVRHGKRVTVHLQCGGFALPLTIHPPEQTLQCGRGQLDFLYAQISDVSLLWVESAPGPQAERPTEAPSTGRSSVVAAPLTGDGTSPSPIFASPSPTGSLVNDALVLAPTASAPAPAPATPGAQGALAGAITGAVTGAAAGWAEATTMADSLLMKGSDAPPTVSHPLGPVLWQLAIRGLRDSLLSDIAGPAAYRVAPGLDLSRLVLGNAEAAAVYRLRRESATARAMADWPGFDRLRATYLLNALYLQAGLIVSRSHPSAIRDSWFSALGAR